jgi:beta-lactamase regulating signal transducer with metallopeptidase domain
MQQSLLNLWFNNEVINALAWTFVHSLWQGLLAAVLAAVIISATKKTGARLRYNLLGTVLILFLLCSFITFFVQLNQGKVIPDSTTSISTTVSDTRINAIDGNTATIISGGFVSDLTNWFNTNAWLLMLAWALLFSVNCLKLVGGLASVHRLRHYKTHPVSDEWKIKLEQLRDKLGIRQSISLLQSELVKVPVALGFLKPVILLPVGLMAQIPAEQVETILLHELGHIRRKDYLVNFIQHFAESVFFFNPGMLWISSLIRQEREACCDDIVIGNTEQKRNYLNALVAFQEYSLRHTPYVMGIKSRRYYLLNRVKRIVTNENKRLNVVEKIALLSGLLIFSAFSFVNQDKKLNEEPLELQGAIYNAQLPFGMIIQKAIIKPVQKPVIPESKRIARTFQPVVDTLPLKKDTTLPLVEPKNSKQLPTEKDWQIAAEKWKTSEKDWADPKAKAKEVLKEIEELKRQIGVQKDEIGKHKEQLKEADKSKQQEIQSQIEKKRNDIEVKRSELERKRSEREKYEEEIDRAEEKEEQMEEKEKAKKKALFDKKGTEVEKDDKKGKHILFQNEKKHILFEKKNSDVKLNNAKVDKKLFLQKRESKLFTRSPQKDSKPTIQKTSLAPRRKPQPPQLKTRLPASKTIQ